MIRAGFLLTASLALGGCAEMRAAREAAQASADEARASEPVCLTEKQCERMWSASRRFVLDTAYFKIETYTPDFIETGRSTESAFPGRWARVTREPGAGDAYRFVFESSCNNFLVCSARADISLKLQFNAAVKQAAAD